MNRNEARLEFEATRRFAVVGRKVLVRDVTLHSEIEALRAERRQSDEFRLAKQFAAASA